MTESLPRKIWRVIYPALLLLFIYLVVYFIAILAYNSFFNKQFQDINSFMSWGGGIVSIIALLAGGIAAFQIYRGDYFASSSYLTEHPVNFIPIAGMGMLAGHGLSILVSLVALTGILGTYTQTQDMLSATGIMITVLKSVILAPLAEELAFRGIVFRRMEHYTNFWLAALVSSAFFGLYHLNLMQGIYAFLYGILLCLVYRTFRNLWATIAMHAAANAFAIIFQCSGLDYPGVAGYVIAMVIALAGAAAIYIFAIRNRSLGK